MKVLVTGATGFIGHRLVQALVASPENHITLVSRNPEAARARFARVQLEMSGRFGGEDLPLHFFGWDLMSGPLPQPALQGVDAVIHLAGEPIGEARWTQEQKRKIRASRMLGTRHLVKALADAEARPRVLISSSAIGFYGDRGDEKLDESSCAGSGFLSEVCRDWEREVLDAEKIEGLRLVRLRTGMVLGRDGGALPRLQRVFRWGAGGMLGSGRQWMSWIHLDDLVAMIEWARSNAEVQGVLNGVAPAPVTNQEFSQTLARVLGRPAWMPAPALALKLALGEMSDLVLQSQRALPRRAIEKGFSFQFEKLDAALENLVAPVRARRAVVSSLR